jgi:hypothetical protein
MEQHVWPPEQLELTAHCLLRLCLTLALEAGGVPHGQDSATAELNTATGRQLSARQWLTLLEPAYQQRFDPGPAPLKLA